MKSLIDSGAEDLFFPRLMAKRAFGRREARGGRALGCCFEDGGGEACAQTRKYGDGALGREAVPVDHRAI